MPNETRTRADFSGSGSTKVPPGAYLGRITNLKDNSHMGCMEVALEKGMPANSNVQSEVVTVNYISPFYGTTNSDFLGSNARNFEDVPKSYGMWFAPPEIGIRGLVLFVPGESAGFWLGCVPDQFQNHMIPGIAATDQVYLTPEQELKYGTKKLPAAEFHPKSKKDQIDPDAQLKPVHPFADRLLAQGLLTDNIRGISSSGARRDDPGNVYGISTPGPIDKNGKKALVGYSEKKSVPITRLGGTQFVMDDGDKAGQNELVRIRTRTGHQILMHNSSDLIYIANGKGTAWIELTSNGKIDIYAQDSVSIHTENDFNFRADRDINIEAGRNLNIRALGNMETNVSGFHNLIIDDYARTVIRNDKDETVGGNLSITCGTDINVLSENGIIATAGASMNLSSENDLYLSTAGDHHFGATGNIYQTGDNIHLNGPVAAAAETADPAELPAQLPLYSLPNRSASAGWTNGTFYKSTPIVSIMQRVPTHEPWDQHENVNPQQFSPASTDVTQQSRAGSGIPETAASQAAASGAIVPANQPEIIPGTCDPQYSKDIASTSSQEGIKQLKDACAAVGITTPAAVASLLGIAGGETRWKTVEEKFNYSAVRLLQVFPTVFKGDLAMAKQYAADPAALPELLYGYNTPKGRGLGNKFPNDGAEYIGRGYIQITGRSNYTRYSKLLFQKKLLSTETELVDNPKALNDPKIAALVSAIYLLDRCKLAQTDPGYFAAAKRCVGFCTPDIDATKTGYYQCFLAQLQGTATTTGPAPVQTNSAGQQISPSTNPTTTGG